MHYNSPASQSYVNVQQMVAAQQLGMLQATYISKNENLVVFFIAGIPGLLGGGFFMCIGMFTGLFAQGMMPSVWIGLYLFLFGLVWFCASLWMLRSVVSYRRVQVYVYTDGLLYTKGGQTEIIRWGEIETLWLNGKFRRTDGTEFNVGKLYSRGNARSSPGHEALTGRIEREMSNHLLPRFLALYHAGTPVFFDTIVVSQQGISATGGSDPLSWHDISSINWHKSVGEDDMHVCIYQGKKVWHSRDIDTIPNCKLLQTFVERIRQEQVQSQLSRLPHLLATYRSGLPVTFGPVSVGLQGVSIDNGKRMYSWDELGTIEVDEMNVIFRKNGKLLADQRLDIGQVPDSALLVALVTDIKRTHVSKQVPQLVASYRAGIPIPFGRISISQQGFSLGNHHRSLPWSEVRRIVIGQQAIQVFKVNRSAPWSFVHMSQVPDIVLLKEFLEVVQPGVI